jgi:DEAD/DEAH box helicase domain-containing protein
MDVTSFLHQIQSHPNYAGQLAHLEVLAERPARYAAPSSPLPEGLQRILEGRGISQLYTHQVEALERARQQEDWVAVTGTASGKTLCYNLPILEASLANPAARALYLFPTKALAQDQLRGLLELVSADPDTADQIRPGVYDGDTPTAQRRRIKAEANVVLSNPDMLHASIMPYHPKWAHFFSELRFIVIDEIHTYRGILGAHVACVLRRLVRICEHYGSRPQFLAASATIANPKELASQLVGREVQVIENDGAPRGPKYFAIWNPSAAGKDRLARRSPTDEAVWLMAAAIQQGSQALAFTRTRQAAELVNRFGRFGAGLSRRLFASTAPSDRTRSFSWTVTGRCHDECFGIGSGYWFTGRSAVGALSRDDCQHLAASGSGWSATGRELGSSHY